MELASNSKYSITPEKVRRDNSDIWRYSKILWSALRKENFSKADPEAYINYCDIAGLLVAIDPYIDIDFRLDVEKFTESLDDIDKKILFMHMLGMKQREMEEYLPIKQWRIGARLKDVIERFKKFYVED